MAKIGTPLADGVAFAGPVSQGAIGVGTAARSSSAPLYTCLMAEKPEKIQPTQQIAGLLDTVNNTCLKKHRAGESARFAMEAALPERILDTKVGGLIGCGHLPWKD